MNKDIIELLGIFLFFSAIVVFVQWLLLRFTHWSVALAATAVIAFVIAFLYVMLSNASPNGGGSGPDTSEFITPMVVAFVSSFCELLLVAYLTKTHLPKAVLLALGIFIAVFTIGRYAYQYVDNATEYQKLFSYCTIEIVNNSGNTVVSEIGFKNIAAGIITTINPNEKEQPYPAIPRFSDEISFRGVSTKNRMFEQYFQFDYSLLQEKDGKSLGLCFWLREKVVLPLKIVLQPNLKVDLYINNKLVQQCQLSGENASNKQTHKGKYK